MANDQNRVLVESIKRLLRRKALPNLRRIVEKTHAADLSIIFRSLPLTDQRKLFNMISDITKKGICLSEMDEDAYLELAAEIPLGEKITRYGREYFYGLSPGFWFVPNDTDLNRHIMKGYGHLLRPTLLFLVIGLVLAVRHIRESSYRTLLITILAAPAGAAIVQVGITRLLVFVIPASLLITLGI